MRVTMPFSLPQVPFGQLRLVQQTSVAEVFAGIDPAGMLVSVLILTDLGAAQPAVRSAFSEAVTTGAYVAGRAPVCAADLAAMRPWVASQQIPGLVGIEWILDAISGSGSATTMNGMPMQTTTWVPPGMESTGWAPVAPDEPAGGFLSRQPAGVIIAMAVCAVLVLVGGTAGIYALQQDKGKPGPSAQSPMPTPAPSTNSQSSGSTTGASGSASATASVEPAITGLDKADLRKVSARTLIGPSWTDSDATYLMQFAGWPFAFRTGKSWGCLKGTVDNMPDASVWICVDEQNSSAKQRFAIMMRKCATTCTSTEQNALNTAWFDPGATPKVAADGKTAYVETAQNADGYYTLDVSTYIVEKPGSGGSLKYQVGITLKSPTATKDVVLKTLNDVYSQIQ